MSDACPKIWILSGGRKGDLDQMQTLAAALGWPTEIKQLQFRGPHSPFFSSWLLKSGGDKLVAPWPNVVLVAEAMACSWARAIKRWSDSKTKLVCLGRPAGYADDFDLIITTAQYRLAPAPQVVELSLPLSGKTVASTQSRSSDLALLLGGPAFPDVLDEAVARSLMADVLSTAQRQNRRVVVVTAPRTPPEVARAVQEMIKQPHVFHGFQTGAGNAYEQVLQKAAAFVVTSDSVSMVADALGTGQPVSVYPLPQKSSFKRQVIAWLDRFPFVPTRWMFDKGIIERPADRRLLFEKLRREKRLVWFGEPEIKPAPAPDDLQQAVTRVRQLVS